MARLMLSARENHKEILIVCPRCKFGSKYSVSYVEDAIHDKLEMTCSVCEDKFKIVIMPLEVAQSNTGLQADGGYAPPNGAFDLPHAIDCVRKRYGLPPTAAKA